MPRNVKAGGLPPLRPRRASDQMRSRVGLLSNVDRTVARVVRGSALQAKEARSPPSARAIARSGDIASNPSVVTPSRRTTKPNTRPAGHYSPLVPPSEEATGNTRRPSGSSMPPGFCGTFDLSSSEGDGESDGASEGGDSPDEDIQNGSGEADGRTGGFTSTGL